MLGRTKKEKEFSFYCIIMFSFFLENVLARNYQRLKNVVEYRFILFFFFSDKLDSLSPLLTAFFCYFKILILESLSVFFICMNIGVFRAGLRAGFCARFEADLYVENAAGSFR